MTWVFAVHSIWHLASHTYLYKDVWDTFYDISEVLECTWEPGNRTNTHTAAVKK